MSSFFTLSRLKGAASPSSNAAGYLPAKKDPHAPQPTPLEKLLADAGPLRTDGSDKFFGFENFGSTCYCNSIIQCLYYSAPFREQVINFPSRSPNQSLPRTQPERLSLNAEHAHHHWAGHKGKSLLGTTPAGAQKGKPAASPSPQGQQGQRPEDNKDSPEYKKKKAMEAGPVISMDYENARAYGMTESLFTSLKDIFEAIIAHESRIGVVSPQKFVEILRRENEMFRTPMHQDAHEFLNLLLNEVVENVEQFSKQMENFQNQGGDSSDPESGLNEAMGAVMQATMPETVTKTNGHSTRWVHELFEGTLTSETRCLTCENTSQRDEAFLDLSVDLEQHTSVTACLRKFSEEEMLCERNKFHCDKCGGLQEAEKRMKVKRLPRILALHLKRFKYTEDLQRLQKLFHRVLYPYYLRLFNTTDDAEDPDRLYELYAVVVHVGGGPYHGHYVSIIKTQDQGWLLFDDEMVEPVDKSYVRNFFGGEGNLACAYVLFYQETTVEAMQAEMEAEGAQKALEPMKEWSPITAKANGTLNGFLHHAHHPSTPMSEDQDHFANLDHAATVPVSATSPTTPMFHPPLEPTPTSPTLPFLNRKKSDILARRLHEREGKEREKKRKHEEKEAEKRKRKEQEDHRREMEQQRRDYHRKQEDELKAAIAASKATKAEEDLNRKSMSHDRPPEKHKENGAFGLHRFRQTSMSLRHKPKLFGSQKDKDRKSKSKERHSQEHLGERNMAAGAEQRPQHHPHVHHDPSTPQHRSTPGEPSSSSAGTSSHATPERKQSHGQVKEKEKERFRFGLGRKKSHMPLQ